MKYKPPKRLEYGRAIGIASAVLLLLLLLAPGVTATAPTGHYRPLPSHTEIEGNISSCGGSRCHLITVRWPTPNPITATHATAYPHPHPDANRSPAGFYPEFVHRQHGGLNWPEWGYQWIADGDGHLGAMASPWGGRLIRGYADTVGGMVMGTGIPRIVSDIAFRRVKTEADRPIAYVQRPFMAAPRGELELAGRPGPMTCSPSDPTYRWGCHGFFSINATGDFDGARRTDNIPCTTCHVNITAATLNHRGVTACGRCHNRTANATVTALSGREVIVIKNCTDSGCHPGNETRHMHAGFDCRYCHGHGHNVSGFNSTYRTGTGCGGASSVCHGPGAENVVTSVIHNRTGSVTKSPTCRHCHAGPGFAGAHNITIPGCDECHNTTTRWGAARTNASVPAWNMNLSATNIHGNATRGTRPGTNCTACHARTSYHDRPTTRNCTDAGCHVGMVSHSTLTCTDCHNNVNTTKVRLNATVPTVNTNVHASWPSRMIPFNISPFRISPKPYTDADCLRCHNNLTAVPGCTRSGCHNVNIHSVTMGVRSNDNNIHEIGGRNCTECHHAGQIKPVDYNATRAGMHRNLTSETNPIRDPIERACRSCHGEPWEYNVTGGHYNRTWRWRNCTHCHVHPLKHNATGVVDHIESRLDVRTDVNTSSYNHTTCVYCHNNSINLSATVRHVNVSAGVSHYGLNRTGGMLMYNASGNTEDCVFCHRGTAANMTRWGINRTTPANLSRRADHATFTTNAVCYGCHGGMPVTFHNASMHPGAAGGRNCTSCHDIGGMAVAEVNVSAMNTTHSIHRNLNNYSQFADRREDRGCWACHTNATFTVRVNYTDLPSGVHPAGYRTPKNCTPCHTNETTWFGAPRTVEHIPAGLTNNTWLTTNATDMCWVCHNNSLVPHIDPNPRPGNATVSHYGNKTLIDAVGYRVTTQGCAYCHWRPANAIRWGRATDLNNDTFPRAHNRTTEANNSDCWPCHIDGNVTVNSFHNISLNPGYDPNCIGCHFSYSYMANKTTTVPGWFNSTTARFKFVNGTMYNASVHRNFSIINCSSCHTNASTPDGHTALGRGVNVIDRRNITWVVEEYNWKWCDSCHVFQSDPMNQTDRHNVTRRPQDSFITVRGVSTSVLAITDCTVCHNATSLRNARANFNSTAVRNCRSCHTFPDRTYR